MIRSLYFGNWIGCMEAMAIKEARHTSNYFTITSADEWLFYFKMGFRDRFRQRFSIVMLDPDLTAVEGTGTFVDNTAFHVEFCVDWLGQQLKLHAKPPASLPTLSHWIGFPPLEGEWKTGSGIGGSLKIQNGSPIVEMTADNGRSQIVADRIHPSLRESPLIISGFSDLEMVLEDFHMLPNRVCRQLPNNPDPKLFVGSVRTKADREPFEQFRDPIILLVTLTGLMLRPHYLTDSTAD
jgi:hypothetical protein